MTAAQKSKKQRSQSNGKENGDGALTHSPPSSSNVRSSSKGKEMVENDGSGSSIGSKESPCSGRSYHVLIEEGSDENGKVTRQEDDRNKNHGKSPFAGRGTSIDDAIAANAADRPRWETGDANAAPPQTPAEPEAPAQPVSRRTSRRKSRRKAGGLRASFTELFSTRRTLDGISIDQLGRRRSSWLFGMQRAQPEEEVEEERDPYYVAGGGAGPNGNWQTPNHPSKFKPISRVNRSSLKDEPNYNPPMSTSGASPSFSEAFGESSGGGTGGHGAGEGGSGGAGDASGSPTHPTPEPNIKEGELALRGDDADRHVKHYWP